jgi:hypothetical protein
MRQSGVRRLSSVVSVMSVVTWAGALLWLSTVCAGCSPPTVGAPPYIAPGDVPVAGLTVGSAAVGGGYPFGTAGISAAAAGTYAIGPSAGAGVFPAAGSGSAGTSGAAGSAGSYVPTGLLPFDAGSDPLRNNVQPGAICARLAAIDCAGEAHCCISPGRSVDTCKQDLVSGCMTSLYLDQIAMNPIAGFDATTTASVFAQLEQRASQCDLGVATWAASDGGLRSIMAGTRAPGTSCMPPIANLTDPPTAGAALASCTGAATTECLPMSLLGAWTCAPKNAAGGSCVTDANCSDGLYCSNPSKALLGKCTARGAVGATCSDGTQCTSFYCAASKCVPPDAQVAYCLKSS